MLFTIIKFIKMVYFIDLNAVANAKLQIRVSIRKTNNELSFIVFPLWVIYRKSILTFVQ